MRHSAVQEDAPLSQGAKLNAHGLATQVLWTVMLTKAGWIDRDADQSVTKPLTLRCTRSIDHQ